HQSRGDVGVRHQRRLQLVQGPALLGSARGRCVRRRGPRLCGLRAGNQHVERLSRGDRARRSRRDDDLQHLRDLPGAVLRIGHAGPAVRSDHRHFLPAVVRGGHHRFDQHGREVQSRAVHGRSGGSGHRHVLRNRHRLRDQSRARFRPAPLLLAHGLGRQRLPRAAWLLVGAHPRAPHRRSSRDGALQSLHHGYPDGEGHCGPGSGARRYRFPGGDRQGALRHRASSPEPHRSSNSQGPRRRRPAHAHGILRHRPRNGLSVATRNNNAEEPTVKRLLPVCGVGLLALALGASPASTGAEPNANATPYATQADPEIVVLDASTAGRGFARSTVQIPVRPGPFTLVYPKWIPGFHGPHNPLADVSELRVSANGQPLTWNRDKVDMYAFHIVVPPGVHSITVRFTVLLNAGGSMRASPHVAVLSWPRVLFYQNDINYHHYYVKASVILPEGWDYSTALTTASHVGQRVDFQEEPLTYVVDSPLDIGLYSKKVLLWQQGDAHMWLDMFADAPQNLDVPAKLLDAYKNVAPEALALYGSRHWADCHALLSLSDAITFEGVEHHQSSDNRAAADFMTNPSEQLVGGDLITHEFSHSWNGKYRRPADLTTPNFQVPMKTDLLWVYEGMNQYLGDVLSFRSGIREAKDYPEYVASIYAGMDYEAGRTTTPLIDLTTAAPYLYEARGDYGTIRRNANDFYDEG